MQVGKRMKDVDDPRKSLMPPRQAAEYLGVSLATLRKMEKDGELIPCRTPRGHRRYTLGMLEEYVGRNRRSVAPGRAEGSN